MLHAHRAEQARQVRRNVGERRTTQPFCPRPRAARFGAASGLEGHGRAQRSEHDRPYHDAPRGSSPATATSDTTPRNTQFDYSADEERLVRRDVDVSTLHFVSDLYQRKFDTFDTTLEERFRLYAGDRQLGEIVRKDGSDKTLFFHTDHLGSTDTISDSTGASFTQHFDPFGTPINPPNPELTRVGFTGQDQDVDLGFTDMKGRMYDPLAGRFASADPVMQAPFWSQGLNLYSYAFNDPINNTDPSGFDATSFDDPVVGVTAWGGGVTGLAAVSGFGASASIGGALGGFGNVAISALTGFPGTAGRLGGTYSGVAPTAAPAAAGGGQGSLQAIGQNKGGVGPARPSLFDPTRGALAQSVPGAEGGPGVETRTDGSGGTRTATRSSAAAAAAPFVLRLPTAAEVFTAVADAFQVVARAFEVTEAASAAAPLAPVLVPGDSVIVQAEGYTDKVGKIAQEAGKHLGRRVTPREINDAIHRVKENLGRGGPIKKTLTCWLIPAAATCGRRYREAWGIQSEIFLTTCRGKSMSSTWAKMSVKISSNSLSASELSRQIGGTPARSAEVGQPVSPRSTSVHAQAFCIYESPISSESTPDEHIAWAISFLESIQDQLSTIRPEPEIDLRLGLSSTEQCCLALTATELSFLGAQGAQINFDVYPSDSESE